MPWLLCDCLLTSLPDYFHMVKESRRKTPLQHLKSNRWAMLRFKSFSSSDCLIMLVACDCGFVELRWTIGCCGWSSQSLNSFLETYSSKKSKQLDQPSSLPFRQLQQEQSLVQLCIGSHFLLRRLLAKMLWCAAKRKFAVSSFLYLNWCLCCLWCLLKSIPLWFLHCN